MRLGKIWSSHKTRSYQPILTRLRSNLLDVLTVTVGDGKNGKYWKSFTVHRNLICSHSAFFRACCNGNWIEAKDAEVELPAESPDTFEVYLQWLYAGQAPMQYMDELYGPPPGPANSYVNLYCLGDRLQDPSFKNVIVNRLIAREDHFPLRYLTLAYRELHERVPSNCGLWRLVIDILAKKYTVGEFEKEKEAMPREVLERLTTTLLKDRAGNCHNLVAAVPRKLYPGSERFKFITQEEDTQPGAPTPERAAFLQQASQCQYHEHDEELNPLT